MEDSGGRTSLGVSPFDAVALSDVVSSLDLFTPSSNSSLPLSTFASCDTQLEIGMETIYPACVDFCTYSTNPA